MNCNGVEILTELLLPKHRAAMGRHVWSYLALREYADSGSGQLPWGRDVAVKRLRERLGISAKLARKAIRCLESHGYVWFWSPDPGVEMNSVPEPLRWAVWERDGFRCRKCGIRQFLTIDHIVPRSRGGSTTLDNLQTLCAGCNMEKGNWTQQEWETQQAVGEG